MTLDHGMAVVSIGVLAVVASGWCWKTVLETPYVPGIEMKDSNGACTGLCTTYYVCQRGDVCATAPRGAETCSDWMANRPVEMWIDGSVNVFGCCQNGTFIGIDTSRTCPTPLALLGMPGCLLLEPAPQ